MVLVVTTVLAFGELLVVTKRSGISGVPSLVLGSDFRVFLEV